MRESVTFVIGGKDYSVPSLSLYWLEECQADIAALTADTPFTQYSGHVLNIVARVLADSDPSIKREALARECSMVEMREFVPKMHELLVVSGFITVGEAEAAAETEASGTGTLIPSSQSSQLTESLTETSTL